jgi:UDP-3-O-[3-hydroxymyristoyl] glucosamine N-acyltransferase
MAELSLKKVAEMLGTRLQTQSPVQENVAIHGVAPIESAAPGEITFVANPKYAPLARTTTASAVLVSEDFASLPTATTAALRTNNPHLAFAKAIELFQQPPKYAPGVHPNAVIHPSAKIGKDCHIGACVVIGANVTVGDYCVLLPHVVLYDDVNIGKRVLAHSHVTVRENCRIGNNVILQPGVVIGSDGFGFAKTDDKKWYKIFQSGIVVIEDNVEIQANSCIDRASMGETRIRAGAKIDNLVQVAHNCDVGESTLLCAQVGLAGSTEIGNNAILAGQVGVVGHLRIGDNVIVTAQSGVPGDVDNGKIVSGSPAFDNKQWLKSVSIFNRLPELAKALRTAAPTASTKQRDREQQDYLSRVCTFRAEYASNIQSRSCSAPSPGIWF